MRGIAILFCGAVFLISTLSNAPGAEAKGQKASTTWTNVYHHEVGVMFHFPDGWTLRESEGRPVIYLVPNEAIPEPRETILVTGGSGDGMTNVADPKLLDSLEALVLQSNSEMKRVGKPEPVKAGERPGMRFTWEAADGKGDVTRIRVYATLLDKYVASLAAYGPAKRVDARDEDLRKIFNTFDFQPAAAASATNAAPAATEELTGMWVKADAESAKMYGVLRADGKALLTRVQASAKKFRDTGETIPDADAGDGPKDVLGKWKTKGSGFTVTTGEDETHDFGYSLKTNAEGKVILRLVPLDGSEPQEWTKEK